MQSTTFLLFCCVFQTTQAQLRGLHYYNGDENFRGVVTILIPVIILCCCCGCFFVKHYDAAREDIPTSTSSHANATKDYLVRERLFTAAASKISPANVAGVGFTGTDHAKIGTISPYSLFAGSLLSSGMKVVSVNNTIVGSAAEARRVIEASFSVVTILAHGPGYYGRTENLVATTATKETPHQSVGVSFTNVAGGVRLGSMQENCLFDTADLAPGMQIVSINNIPVESSTHAVELTRNSFPLVTILAQREAAVAVAVAPISSAPVQCVAAVPVGSESVDIYSI